MLFAKGNLPFLSKSTPLPATEPEEVQPPTAELEEPGIPLPSDNELPADKYLKDTDKDGFPNFLEVGTGYDPSVVDCAREANCQAAVGMNPKSENNVLFILDSSGSMAGQVSGQPKMQVAKQAVSNYIDQMSASFNVGLVVYGHRGSNSAVDKTASCAGIETLYPLSKVDKEAFKQKVASFQPTGWTPIADSLQKAKNEVFVGREKDNNSIILVSDGIETCGGDPCGMARQLASLGISPVIDVIGFDVDAQAQVQLQCVARVTNGQYFDARTVEEFKQAFDQFAQRAEEFEGTALCLNENFESFAACMDEQVLASMEYLDKEKIAALDAGDQERVAELDKIVARLNQKYQDFLTGFEGEYTSGMEELLEEYKEGLGEEFNVDEILTPEGF